MKKIVFVCSLLISTALNAQGIGKATDYEITIFNDEQVIKQYSGTFSIFNPVLITDNLGSSNIKISMAGNQAGTQLYFMSDKLGSCEKLSKVNQVGCSTEHIKVLVNLDK